MKLIITQSGELLVAGNISSYVLDKSDASRLIANGCDGVSVTLAEGLTEGQIVDVLAYVKNYLSGQIFTDAIDVRAFLATYQP